jgi:hypothetical protein
MNNNSGVNTILIVVILVLIVGFGVWYFKGNMMGAPAEEPDAGLEVNIGGEGEGTNE